jgi:hypothetical protein
MSSATLCENLVPATFPLIDDSHSAFDVFDDHAHSWQSNMHGLLDPGLEIGHHIFRREVQEFELHSYLQPYINEFADDGVVTAENDSQWGYSVSEDLPTPFSTYSPPMSSCVDMDEYTYPREEFYTDSPCINTSPELLCLGGTPVSLNSSRSSSLSLNGTARSTTDNTVWSCPWKCGKSFRRRCELR